MRKERRHGDIERVMMRMRRVSDAGSTGRRARGRGVVVCSHCCDEVPSRGEWERVEEQRAAMEVAAAGGCGVGEGRSVQQSRVVVKSGYRSRAVGEHGEG